MSWARLFLLCEVCLIISASKDCCVIQPYKLPGVTRSLKSSVSIKNERKPCKDEQGSKNPRSFKKDRIHGLRMRQAHQLAGEERPGWAMCICHFSSNQK